MRKFILFLVPVLILSQIASAALIKSGDNVELRKSSSIMSDLYMFGKRIEVFGEVKDDLIAAGRNITIDGNIGQNLFAAAQYIELNGRVRNEFIGFAQGIEINNGVTGGFKGGCQTFVLNDTVWGDVIVGAASVEIAPDAVIYGSLYTGAGDLDIAGLITGNVIGAAGEFYLSGTIDKTVKLTVDKVRFAQEASVGGSFMYRRESELDIDFADQVEGKVLYKQFSHDDDDDEDCDWICGAWIFAGSIIIILLLGGLFGKWMSRGYILFVNRGWITLLIGFLAFIVIPIAAILSLITFIGIPLGIIIFMFYGISVYLGWNVAAIILGAFALKSFGVDKMGWIVSGIAGLVALSLLGMIPFVGCLINFAVVVIGLGFIISLLHEALFASK